MRISKWLVAAGVLSFSGLALAQDQSDINNQPNVSSKKKTKSAKPHVVGQGSDVRTSYDQPNVNNDVQVRENTQEAKQNLKEAGQNVGEAAQSAGQSASQGVQKAGSEVGSAIREGSNELAAPKQTPTMGFLGSGKAIRNTITTDPIGMAIGAGINAEYTRALGNKWDVVGGTRFAHTRIGDGFANNFGVDVGADYYILGRNNEGLRIGPRLDLGLGGASAALVDQTAGTGLNSSLAASLGAGGELGYNWVANNGLSAGAAAGLRGRLAESSGATVNNTGFGPYAKLNLGYSW